MSESGAGSLAMVLAAAALAVPAPSGAGGGGGAVDDLFGDSLDTSGGLDDLQRAASGVGPASRPRSGGALRVRRSVRVGDGKVRVKEVFAAPRIRFDKGSCVAVPNRVTYFVAPDFPFEPDPFSVCARLEGGAGRSMRMSVVLMTGRGKVVGRAESVADFTGKRRLDHAIDFKNLVFPEPGVYRYVVEIEGERVANLPIFEVRPLEDN